MTNKKSKCKSTENDNGDDVLCGGLLFGVDAVDFEAL